MDTGEGRFRPLKESGEGAAVPSMPDLNLLAWCEQVETYCAAATKGPWSWGVHDGTPCLIGKIHGQSVIFLPFVEFENSADHERDYRVGIRFRRDYDMVEMETTHPDAVFIPAARTDLPIALAVIRELVREKERLREALTETETI